jgi:hypothetical protein
MMAVQDDILTSTHHLIYFGTMRTTVDLDEDVLRVAKDLARERDLSVGRVLSDLARRALKPSNQAVKVRNGVPILPRKAGAKPVTSEIVKDLLESGN